MTQLLAKAIREVAKLPDSERDALAEILLQELVAEDRWTKSSDKSQILLERLATEALAEHPDAPPSPGLDH